MTGSGTPSDPYKIYNVNDLQAINNDLSAYYELANDIDASVTSGWNGGLGFNPIGSSSPYFTGSLDGKGFSISGLFINRPKMGNVGLFSYVNRGSLKNIKLVGVNITGQSSVGGLIGASDGTTSINNCQVSGHLKATDVGEVGGIIGSAIRFFDNGDITIKQCNVSGSIGWSGIESVGGIVGENRAKLTIEKSYSTCSVTGSYYVGGLVGLSGYGGVLKIKQCFTTGDITSSVWGAGGLVGDSFNMDDLITDCYARGNVSGDRAVGGAFGSFYDGHFGNIYSTGVVMGNTDVGGLHGYNGGAEEISPCFWDVETSGQTNSRSGTGKTTAQMKTRTTFIDAGWNFRRIWAIRGCNDGYPCLIGVTPRCRAKIFQHPTIPTEPNRGKIVASL